MIQNTLQNILIYIFGFVFTLLCEAQNKMNFSHITTIEDTNIQYKIKPNLILTNQIDKKIKQKIILTFFQWLKEGMPGENAKIVNLELFKTQYSDILFKITAEDVSKITGEDTFKVAADTAGVDELEEIVIIEAYGIFSMDSIIFIDGTWNEADDVNISLRSFKKEETIYIIEGKIIGDFLTYGKFRVVYDSTTNSVKYVFEHIFKGN